MSQQTDKFVDFFFNGIFDADQNHDLRRRTGIYYLHGALHLFSGDDGTISKIQNNGDQILERSLVKIEEGGFPYFISEGTSTQKLKVIRSSEYLRFALSEFKKSDRKLLILGHGLADVDQHLIDGMNTTDWKNRKIAISVHPSFCTDIKATKHALASKLPNAKLEFFDSTTHPLGSSNLTV